MLTITILLLGTLTVLLSLFAAREFMRTAEKIKESPSYLSAAISWQLWGESFIGAGTLLFAVAAHYGWLDSWSPEFQNTIRLAMFIATSITTAHLCLVIRRIRTIG